MVVYCSIHLYRFAPKYISFNETALTASSTQNQGSTISFKLSRSHPSLYTRILRSHKLPDKCDSIILRTIVIFEILI